MGTHEQSILTVYGRIMVILSDSYYFVGMDHFAIVQASQKQKKTKGFKMLTHLMRTGARAKVVGVVNKSTRTVMVRYVDAEEFYDDMYKLGCTSFCTCRQENHNRVARHNYNYCLNLYTNEIICVIIFQCISDPVNSQVQRRIDTNNPI